MALNSGPQSRYPPSCISIFEATDKSKITDNGGLIKERRAVT
jgi:hypothetical protein